MTTGKGIAIFGFFLWLAADDFIPEYKGKYYQPNPIDTAIANVIMSVFDGESRNENTTTINSTRN